MGSPCGHRNYDARRGFLFFGGMHLFPGAVKGTGRGRVTPKTKAGAGEAPAFSVLGRAEEEKDKNEKEGLMGGMHQHAGVCGFAGEQRKTAVRNGFRKIERTGPVPFEGMDKVLEDHGALPRRHGR